MEVPHSPKNHKDLYELILAQLFVEKINLTKLTYLPLSAAIINAGPAVGIQLLCEAPNVCCSLPSKLRGA